MIILCTVNVQVILQLHWRVKSFVISIDLEGTSEEDAVNRLLNLERKIEE